MRTRTITFIIMLNFEGNNLSLGYKPKWRFKVLLIVATSHQSELNTQSYAKRSIKALLEGIIISLSFGRIVEPHLTQDDIIKAAKIEMDPKQSLSYQQR